MAVRVGIDVGAATTTAVAYDVATRRLVGAGVVATTHQGTHGVLDGVHRAVARTLAAAGQPPVALVAMAGTLDVDLLLQGDAGTVGLLGLGRFPSLRQAGRRSRVRRLEPVRGRRLATRHALLDVSRGVDPEAAGAAVDGLLRSGVAAIGVLEAFAPIRAGGAAGASPDEQEVAALVAHRGGLALTADRLTALRETDPRAEAVALATALLPAAGRLVQLLHDTAHTARLGGVPLVLLRGDGGATDTVGAAARPVTVAASGVAAMVAGVLRMAAVEHGVVADVGSCTTKLVLVRRGRPVAGALHVGGRSTGLPGPDTEVVAVGSGAVLRVQRRRLRMVGPRSAAAVGMAPASSLAREQLHGAQVELVALRPGDPDDHLVLRLGDGTRAALTAGCAAVALGLVGEGDPGWRDPAAAVAAFAIAGTHLDADGPTIARQALQAVGETLCEAVLALQARHPVHPGRRLPPEVLVAVGGGAGGLGRHLAAMLGIGVVVPADGPLLGALGAALSPVPARRERHLDPGDAAAVRALLAEVQEEAAIAGAGSGTIDVRLEEHPERGTVAAVAVGAVTLSSGALPGRAAASTEGVERAAAALGGGEVWEAGAFWLVVQRRGDRPQRVLVLDRFADVAARVEGELTPPELLADTVERLTRGGPRGVERPSVWLIDGPQLLEVAGGDVTAAVQGMIDPLRPPTCIVGRRTTEP